MSRVFALCLMLITGCAYRPATSTVNPVQAELDRQASYLARRNADTSYFNDIAVKYCPTVQEPRDLVPPMSVEAGIIVTSLEMLEQVEEQMIALIGVSQALPVMYPMSPTEERELIRLERELRVDVTTVQHLIGQLKTALISLEAQVDHYSSLAYTDDDIGLMQEDCHINYDRAASIFIECTGVIMDAMEHLEPSTKLVTMIVDRPLDQTGQL